MSSNKAPIFPMPQPQHFSDYGFDPQIDYFQVLEEARKHKGEATRSIDSIHFKLSKPISKDHHAKPKKPQSSHPKRKPWWRTALLLLVNLKARTHRNSRGRAGFYDEDVHQARARAFRASISGPVYITDSRSGAATPRRSSGRYSSGPLAGTLSPADDDDLAGAFPYVSLRELNMEQQQRISTSSAMPIYLVT